MGSETWTLIGTLVAGIAGVIGTGLTRRSAKDQTAVTGFAEYTKALMQERQIWQGERDAYRADRDRDRTRIAALEEARDRDRARIRTLERDIARLRGEPPRAEPEDNAG